MNRKNQAVHDQRRLLRIRASDALYAFTLIRWTQTQYTDLLQEIRILVQDLPLERELRLAANLKFEAAALATDEAVAGLLNRILKDAKQDVSTEHIAP